MPALSATYFYCYANGVAKFGKKVPDGAIEIDRQTAKQREAEKARMKKIDPILRPLSWKESLMVKCRLSYDGKTALIPGIPEAENQREALNALTKFKAWAVKPKKRAGAR